MSDEDLFGPVIYSYSRQQAIEDGVLIPIPESVSKSLYLWPICISQSINNLIGSAENEPGCSRDGIIWDILWMSQRGIIRRLGESMVEFQVIIHKGGQQKTYTMRAVCGPDDDGNACLTIMMPWED